MDILYQKRRRIVEVRGRRIVNTDYDSLNNLPTINGVPLQGDMVAEDLGLATPDDIITDYEELGNLPKINGVTVVGAKLGKDYGLANISDLHSDNIRVPVNNTTLSDVITVKYNWGSMIWPDKSSPTPGTSFTKGRTVRITEMHGGATRYPSADDPDRIVYAFDKSAADVPYNYCIMTPTSRTDIDFPILKPFDYYDGENIIRQTSDVVDISNKTGWEVVALSGLDSNYICARISFQSLGITDVDTVQNNSRYYARPCAWLTYAPSGTCTPVYMSALSKRQGTGVAANSSHLYVLLPYSAYSQTTGSSVNDRVNSVLLQQGMTKFMYITTEKSTEHYGELKFELEDNSIINFLTPYPCMLDVFAESYAVAVPTYIDTGLTKYYVDETSGGISLPAAEIRVNNTNYKLYNGGRVVQLPNLANRVTVNGATYSSGSDGGLSLPTLAHYVIVNGTTYTTGNTGIVSLPALAAKVRLLGTDYSPVQGTISLPSLAKRITVNGMSYDVDSTGQIQIPRMATYVKVDGTTYYAEADGQISLPNLTRQVRVNGQTSTADATGLITLPDLAQKLISPSGAESAPDYLGNTRLPVLTSSDIRGVDPAICEYITLKDILDTQSTGQVATIEDSNLYVTLPEQSKVLITEMYGGTYYMNGTLWPAFSYSRPGQYSTYPFRYFTTQNTHAYNEIPFEEFSYGLQVFDYAILRLKHGSTTDWEMAILYQTSDPLDLTTVGDWELSTDSTLTSDTVSVYARASLESLGISNMSNEEGVNVFWSPSSQVSKCCEFSEMVSQRAGTGYAMSYSDGYIYIGVPADVYNSTSGDSTTARMRAIFGTADRHLLLYKKAVARRSVTDPMFITFKEFVCSAPAYMQKAKFVVVAPTPDQFIPTTMRTLPVSMYFGSQGNNNDLRYGVSQDEVLYISGKLNINKFVASETTGLYRFAQLPSDVTTRITEDIIVSGCVTIKSEGTTYHDASIQLKIASSGEVFLTSVGGANADGILDIYINNVGILLK